MKNDLVSDMLTRIYNASMVKHNIVFVPYSKLNIAILKILNEQNYIKSFYITFDLKKLKMIKIFLKYNGWWIKKSFFSILKRISKPGKRVFSSYRQFNIYIKVLNSNKGIAIISTSIGIMSHFKAIELKQGGEILCYIE